MTKPTYKLKIETLMPNDSINLSQVYVDLARHATMHPTVKSFLEMSNEDIVNLFCSIRPHVNRDLLLSKLNTPAQRFLWAGPDIIPTIDAAGNKVSAQRALVLCIPTIWPRTDRLFKGPIW